MLRSSVSQILRAHGLKSLTLRSIALSAGRRMGEVAAVPEGTISTKTGLPVTNKPLPKASPDYLYEDRSDIPIPLVPFIENPNAEQQALLKLQTGDWKAISLEDKRKIYNLKFQWSMDDLRHLKEDNSLNIIWTVMILIGLAMTSYELMGIYTFERSPRPWLIIEPRMTQWRCKIKKFLNKVDDVVSPQYLQIKYKEEEIEGVEL